MFFQGIANRLAGPRFAAGPAPGSLSKGLLVSVFGSTRGINAASQRVAVAGGTAIDTSAAGVSFVSGVQGPLFAPYGIPSTITEVTIVARVVLPTATFTELPLLYLGGAYDSSGNQFTTYIYHYGGDLYFTGPGILDAIVSSAPTGAFDIAVSASLGPTNGVVVYVNGVQVRTGTGSSITPAVTPVYACIASRPEQNATIPSGAAVGYAHAFMRALSADEIRRVHENPTGLLRRWSVRTTSAAGGSSFSLTVHDASHSHAVDNLVLSSSLGLTVQDSAHAHAADSLTLSAALALAVADAIHGHAADNLALSTGLALSVAGAAHGHTADAPTLSAALALVVADAAHGHSADSLTLDTGTALVIADALHSHTADSPALSSALSLLIADATHGHGADAITLTTALSLVIADALHSHAAENIDLVAGAQLAIQGAGHGHTAESLVLSQALSLAINNALHAHSADALALTEALTLAINDALHAHGADNIVWPGQSAANLLRVASVYVRLMGQHPFVRIEENTEYLRIGNPAQTVRAN